MSFTNTVNAAIATDDLNWAHEQHNEITFTSTPYISPELLAQSFIKKCNRLKTQDRVFHYHIEELERDLEQIPRSSASYGECQYHLRKLSRKLTKAPENSSTENVSSLESFLIQQKIEPFINAGKHGRAWIVKRLFHQDYTTFTSEELHTAILPYLTILEDEIAALNKAEDRQEVIKQLSELDIMFENDKEAEKVSELWLEEGSACSTLTEVNKLVTNFSSKVDEEGTVDHQIDEEMLNRFRQ